MTVHFNWIIDSTTPNGFYSFIVKKNYTDKTLTSSLSFQVNFKAPFIAKFQLNPDALLSINLDNTYSYDFYVDWSDGSPVEHITGGSSISHQYTGSPTEATIRITGNLPAFKMTLIDPNNRTALIAQAASFLGMDVASIEVAFASYSTSDLYALLENAGVPLIVPAFNSKLTEITQFGSIGLRKMDNLFQTQTLLVSVGPGDLSSVESMKSAFQNIGSNSPVTFNTTGWGLRNVVDAIF